jgi:hypothetical protein
MATIGKIKCRAYQTKSGNSPEIRWWIQGTAETFKKGALLYLTASNTVRYVALASGAGTGFDTVRKRIVGIALKDADNITLQATANAGTTKDYLIPVHMANSDTVFISNIISRTSAAVSTLQYADMGKACCASLNASVCYVDRSSSAASSILKVVDFVDGYPDKYGRVLWQLLPAAYAFER